MKPWPTDAEPTTDDALPDAEPILRADLHALVETLPAPVLAPVTTLLRLIVRFVASDHAQVVAWPSLLVAALL